MTPFGGYKDSGIGRENGEEGLNNYLELKTVIERLWLTLQYHCDLSYYTFIYNFWKWLWFKQMSNEIKIP